MAGRMGRIVYVKVTNSGKPAHQYVNFDSERVGEIWREQVDVVDAKGNTTKRWRWFATQYISTDSSERAEATRCTTGYGSKDKAVDTLEFLLALHR